MFMPPDRDLAREEETHAKKVFAILQHHLHHHVPAETRAHLQSVFTEQWLQEPVTVETPRGPLSFVLLGKTSARRAATLLTKQPGTLAWIDAMAPDSVLWDVGANVGVYTLYAALRPDLRVVAFEPVAVNYFLLAANCELNHVEHRVTALPIGLIDDPVVVHMEASQFRAAKSFSVFGKPDEPHASRQAALMLTLDRLAELLPRPHYLKIDVPDLRGAILTGGARLLRDPTLREVHIEVEEGDDMIVQQLVDAGFRPATGYGHRQRADVTFVRSDTHDH